MRTYEEKEELTKRSVLIETKCDICGKIAKYGSWEKSTWDVEDVEVSVSINHKSGKSYPECSWGTTYNVDLCPECFQKKLIPWLESQGAEISEKEYDY